jgi:hypothetical protein
MTKGDTLPSEISDKYEQLKRIHRNQEMYGVDREPSHRARRFRIAEILPLVVKKIRDDWQPQTKEPVDLLVSLSGHSPETTVVAFELLRPERLLVLQSEGSPQSIDTIVEHLNCPPSRIEVRQVDPNDPLAIYSQIEHVVDRIRRRSLDSINAVIDITGGKKVMSAAAALAATQLDLRLCYIDGEYDSAMRQPIPGTEDPILLSNPTDLFMDREMDKASELLAHGDFPASARRFEEISEKTMRPARARFGKDLANCYLAWCNFDHEDLKVRIPVLQQRVDTSGYRPRPETLDRIKLQLEFMSGFTADPNGIELTLSYFLMAGLYREREQHALAIQLHYRALEHLLCRHLEQRAEGFNCKSPVWSLLSDDLAARFLPLAARVYRTDSPRLPDRVGLMDGALLLNALEDPVMRALGLDTNGSLLNLRGKIEVRNGSVLAHGTNNIEPSKSREFEKFVRHRLAQYWSLDHDHPKFDEYLDDLKFIKRI